MAYMAAKDRFQTRITSLEEAINKDNSVRFIDAFVNTLDLARLNVEDHKKLTEGWSLI